MTKVLRPGQSTPNDFETAILERIALDNPSLREHFGRLHVLSREFTGVGSYTNFRIPEVDAQATRTPVPPKIHRTTNKVLCRKL